MSSIHLFPFTEYWLFYVLFTAAILLILLFDLGVLHREAREVTFQEATVWSIVWIILALLFNLGFYYYAAWAFAHDPRLQEISGFLPQAAAKRSALEFLTGYIVERALAMDNIFVFVVVFKYFGIPLKYQHRILFFGIIGALLFRILFIALGTLLLQFQIMVIVFGVLILITGLKLLFTPDKPIEPEKNPIIQLMSKRLPILPRLAGQRFWVREEGKLLVTPLFVTLIFIEISDIVFAVDSVPAIFAITSEPLIVYTSNVFAILGLRAMFFLLAGVVHLFHYLKYGLGLVLIFVGLKMVWLNQLYHGHFPIGWSLGIILAIIGTSIGLSLAFPQHQQDQGAKTSGV